MLSHRGFVNKESIIIMKDTTTFSTFHDAFLAIRPDNFSYHGLTALYDYLVALEEGCGFEFELDVIAFCCDYSEIERSEHYEHYDDKEHAEDLICREFKDGGETLFIVREV